MSEALTGERRRMMKTRGRSLALTALIVLTGLASAKLAGAQAAAERPRFGASQRPRVTSPEVAADGRVTFRILAAKAGAVRLGGSDIPNNAEETPLTKGAEGIWEVTLGPFEPGAYRYNFNVDGVPVTDPRNPSSSESQENAWSLVYVPGSDFMDAKDVPHGAVAEVTYYSKALKRFRRMRVYTPPEYESGKGRYPVFYLLHGAYDSDDAWTSVGRAGFILDNLIAAGKVKPMVVVMPAGHTGPVEMGGPRPAVDDFVADFTGDVMPYVEKTYRLRADRAHRAIAGLSMGGAQTLSIVMSDMEKFAYVGVYSSGVFGIIGRGLDSAPGPSFEERHRKALDDAAKKKGLKLFWFSTGKEDFLLETSRATVEMLRKHGFNVVYKESSGGHTWINWRNYFSEFAPQLFR